MSLDVVTVRRPKTPPPSTCWAPSLAHAWAMWRRGALVCARGGLVAVEVMATPEGDPACALYRLRCALCGLESPWFTAEGDELRTVRDAPTDPSIPAAPSV